MSLIQRPFRTQSLKTLGSFVFSYAADRQTEKLENPIPTPTDKVAVGNDISFDDFNDDDDDDDDDKPTLQYVLPTS